MVAEEKGKTFHTRQTNKYKIKADSQTVVTTKNRMASKQSSMTQTITQAVKSALMAVKEAENAVNTVRSVQVMPSTGSPTLNSQPLIGRQQTNTKNYETLKYR